MTKKGKPRTRTEAEVNKANSAFWDVPDLPDEQRCEALRRLKDGKGDWNDFEAFAKDFVGRAPTHQCRPETIEWLQAVLRNVLDGGAPPKVFGATKKRGQKPNDQRNQLRRLVTVYQLELWRREGITGVKATRKLMQLLVIDERSAEKEIARTRKKETADTMESPEDWAKNLSDKDLNGALNEALKAWKS